MNNAVEGEACPRLLLFLAPIRTVQVPEGKRQVEFRFVPLSLYAGLLISLLSVLAAFMNKFICVNNIAATVIRRSRLCTGYCKGEH